MIKVGAAALNQTPLDWEGNLSNIKKTISEAHKQNISVLCLPELCTTGYGCEDAFFSPFVQRKAQNLLYDIAYFCIASKYSGVVSVGLPVLFNNALFNCSALIVDGQVLGFVPKQHLAGDGVHYEPRWFKPWTGGVSKIKCDITGMLKPFGDISFKFGKAHIGFEICEDAWVTDRPGINLVKRGVNIILNPSASHFAFGKHEIRKRFVLEGSRSQNTVYVYSNLLGNESGRMIFDGDTMIASCGNLVASGDRFSFRDYIITSANVDLDKCNVFQSKLASFAPNNNDACIIYYSLLENNLPSSSEISEAPLSKHEEFTKAATLGLFDYMRKSHSNGFTLSLSGGVDSSACAYLVYKMKELVENELGHDAFAHKTNIEDMHGLLTCVYQSTKNSSQETFKAASELSKSIGAKFINWNVDDIVDSYCNKISSSLSINLNWNDHDITLQNIQARVRSPGAWMLANLNNSLLLSTSNRSEAAVGYTTMDGDSSGGLAPLAGIDKNFLISWLKKESGLFDSLKLVFKQKPSAELRPDTQTDEQDLMPYDVLDLIERLAIVDKKSPVEIYYSLQSNYDKALLKSYIKKFFTLWCRNQWKRERFAVSFHYDDENLDPKTWCRWPVLSSGLKEEIQRMCNL